MIAENLKNIIENVRSAAGRAGRNPDDIEIICVSKNQGTDKIREAIKAGFKIFGENRVQEFMEKYDCFDDDISWHIIGHLQTNKVKYIIGKVDLIHSVDSLKLIKEINRISEKKNIVTKVLVQINISEEDSKYGIGIEDAKDFIIAALPYKNVEISGLMTIGANTEDDEIIRKGFRKMYNKFMELKSNGYRQQMRYLSMGMSSDYEIAVEEGTNMIRVGSAVFGSRKY